jgi:hypothetical protein
MAMKKTDDITCAMCNARFSAEEGAATCARCALFAGGGCHKVRCPRCGYEMPAPARLPGVLAQVLARLTGKKGDT